MSTQETDSGLDAEELLHLAMKAMEAGDQESTIAYLKRGLSIAPEDGRIYYLLGAIHAELGMHERAIEELTRATELAPHLETAHFQLGLLHAARGDLERALVAWQPFEAPSANVALQLFRRGVVHLANQEYAACIADIREGMVRNTEYAALNADMARLVTQAEGALAAGMDEAAPGRADALESQPFVPAEEAQHLLLSRYQTGPESGR